MAETIGSYCSFVVLIPFYLVLFLLLFSLLELAFAS